MNKELIEYLNTNILVEYKNFDHGHDEKHVNAVVNRSLQIVKQLELNVDLDMVYCVAVYHDYGIKFGRENHAKSSKELLLKDKNLLRFFSKEQIEIMADAVEDHSTSSDNKPRSIYGEIVSDADKDIDVSTGILRGYLYSLSHNPNFTFEEHVENVRKEMIRRFCKNERGERLVKFYRETQEQTNFVNEMERLAKNKNELYEKLANLIK